MHSILSGNLRARVIGLYGVLIAANLAAWAWALIVLGGQPILLGTAMIAYGFGLRHAVDADHIAAIDNVTRKLMQDGKKPAAIGFFFSLGHSTVVVLATLVIAVAAAALQTRFAAFKEVGGLVGTGVSAFFLLAIGIANLFVLAAVYRAFQEVKRGGRYVEEDLDVFLAQRGFLGRIFRPLFRLIRSSWQMYPLGFLFGLGFGTATEIALLGMSAVEASKGLSIWSILIFPALFTAGMSLVDTTDGILMLGAYGWAFMKPVRKLYYNLTITFISVVVAVVIGGVEALGLIAGKLDLDGWFWDGVGTLNENFGSLGFLIIGIFAASWIVSLLVYRLKRYDDIEVTSG